MPDISADWSSLVRLGKTRYTFSEREYESAVTMDDTSVWPLAFCLNCGPFEAVGTIGIPDDFSGRLRILGSITDCPACNRPCEFIPGTYQKFGNRLKLLIDRSISQDALAALIRLAEKAEAGEITSEEAEQQAEEIVPGAGQLFNVRDWSGQAKATLYASIIGAGAIIYAAHATSSSKQVINVQPVIERSINLENLLSTTSLTPPKEPPLPIKKPKKHQ